MEDYQLNKIKKLSQWLRFLWAFSWMKLFLLVAFSYHTYEVYLTNQAFCAAFGHPLSAAMEVLAIFYGFVSLIVFYVLLDLLFSRVRWLRVLFNILFLMFFGWTSSYYFGVSCSPDFALIAETIRDGMSSLTLEIAAQWLDPIPLEVAGIFSIIFLIAEFFRHAISKYDYSYQWGRKVAVVAGLVVLMIVCPIDPHNEVSRFARVAYRYYAKPVYKNIHIPKNEFPYIKPSFDYTDMQRSSEKPNVFVIVIESFNERFVGAKTKDGKEVTPFFNQLKEQGLYVDHYYSPTVLSMIGYGAMYTSVLPAMRGIMLRTDTDVYCYPKVFAENGYKTMLFIQEEPYFPPKAKQVGFEDYKSIYDLAKPEDYEYRRSSTCYEDRVVYKYVFKHLDELEAQRKKTGEKKPFFANIITLYNHTAFDAPENRRLMVKDPKNLRERYMNTVYLSDQGLAQFFKELAKRPYLKNSLVVITGDHGYPTGEHGIGTTELGVFEESFRVPFLMIWTGVIKPAHIKPTEAVYSHIDLAPTLIDLLKLKVDRNHMTGQSIFATRLPRPVRLIQPYNGTYLMSVRYPWKYRKHVRSDKEYLYNLAEDPHEEKNFLDNFLVKPPVDLAVFRKDVEYGFVNQYLMEHNQIWKAKKESK